MITPTVGRKVWFTPANNDRTKEWDPKQPMDATIVYVHGDRLINIVGSDHSGIPFKEGSVMLLQDDDSKPGTGRFVTWMPYQQGQAKAQGSATMLQGPVFDSAVHLMNALSDLAKTAQEGMAAAIEQEKAAMAAHQDEAGRS